MERQFLRMETNRLKDKHMEKELFKQFGYRFVDWVAEYFEEIEKYPVLSQVEPGIVRGQLPEKAPYEGESIETVFEDFKKIIVPGITHWQHPSWFAYFPANNSPPSVLAEAECVQRVITNLAHNTIVHAAWRADHSFRFKVLQQRYL